VPLLQGRWGTTAQERIGKPRVADLDFRLRIEINESTRT